MNVVLVESQPFVRDVITKLCVTEFDYKVVSATASAPDAVAAIQFYRPDLVILDLILQVGSGFDVIRETTGGKHRTMILSSCCSEYAVWRVSRVNVHGFLAKEEMNITSLKDAVTSVGMGARYWSERYRSIRLKLLTDPFSFVKILTNAELRVLSLVGRGLLDDEIGIELGIASRTAQTHRSNLSRKLGVHTPNKLMVYAIDHGLHRFEVEKEGLANVPTAN